MTNGRPRLISLGAALEAFGLTFVRGWRGNERPAAPLGSRSRVDADTWARAQMALKLMREYARDGRLGIVIYDELGGRTRYFEDAEFELSALLLAPDLEAPGMIELVDGSMMACEADILVGGLHPQPVHRVGDQVLEDLDEHASDPVINYVGLRADEDRVGYISTKPNITAVYPFQEDGLVRADIIRILEDSGLGLPAYMDWGRSRSGCYFCFYQQKIEWVRLLETYPKYFELARQYEEKTVEFGEQFYWCQNETLRELSRPERVAEIKAQHEAAEAKRKARRRNLPLVQVLGGLEPEDPPHLRDGCLVCSI